VAVYAGHDAHHKPRSQRVQRQSLHCRAYRHDRSSRQSDEHAGDLRDPRAQRVDGPQGDGRDAGQDGRLCFRPDGRSHPRLPEHGPEFGRREARRLHASRSRDHGIGFQLQRADRSHCRRVRLPFQYLELQAGARNRRLRTVSGVAAERGRRSQCGSQADDSRSAVHAGRAHPVVPALRETHQELQSLVCRRGDPDLRACRQGHHDQRKGPEDDS